ncbi:hypothetical protein BHE74_00042694 [Ensete ventricosum]|nr:hypothetical protein BHE74_00042694 [Ensete ventricosum]RZS13108.1 hypothetical protein BHM03_00044637 [Ensete ventricosum]
MPRGSRTHLCRGLSYWWISSGSTRFSRPRSVASRTPLIRRGPRGLTNRPRKDPHASARACHRGLSVRGPGSAVHVDLWRRNLISRGI